MIPLPKCARWRIRTCRYRGLVAFSYSSGFTGCGDANIGVSLHSSAHPAVLFGIVATLYVTVYFASPAARARGQFEVSQPVWAIFLVLNVALTYASRALVREVLERRWRAGIGLKRILIAGSGELGRLVADKILEHRELGYQIIGFVDDRPRAITSDTAAALLGTIYDTAEISARGSICYAWRAPRARPDAAAHRKHEPRVRRRQGGARSARR